jgi:hypothetical protein
MHRRLITTYAKLGHGRQAGGQVPPSSPPPPPPPPSPPPQAPPWEDAEEEQEKEVDDVYLSFYEFLEGLDATQEGEVAPADLQVAIAASFETYRQERDVSTAAQRGDGSSAPVAQPSSVAPPGDGPRQGRAPARHRRQHHTACSGQHV